MLVVLIIFPTLVPVLRVQTLMLLLPGFPLLVLPLSLPDWMPECTTVLTIIFSLNMIAPSALPTIIPEWTSHCIIFHLLDVESLSMETLLPGWTTNLTILLLLAVDGSGARSHDYHSYQTGGSSNQNLSGDPGLLTRSDNR
jgi:hypothetical protein